jgi:transcriptional regulator with XRE-family HTH domain
MNIWSCIACNINTRWLLFTEMNIRHIGEVIKARREVLCIDQRSLSEISGVAVHTLSNIEAGNGNPTVKSLNKVLGALGMELRVDLRR